MGTWVKKKMWIVTIFVEEQDEDGEDSGFSENYYADTYEEAARMKEKFLNGEDKFYGSSVVNCVISDEPEEGEFWCSEPNIAAKEK